LLRREIFAFEELGHRFHFRGIGTAGMQKSAAHAIDRPGILPGQRQNVALHTFRVVKVDVCQSLPAPPDADNFMSVGGAPIHHILDDGIQTGNITASGQDADFLSSHWSPVF
jgi:hypothetical protein